MSGLLIHGDAGASVPIDHSRAAHTALPRSRLIVMRQGIHLAFSRRLDAPDTRTAGRWLTDTFTNNP